MMNDVKPYSPQTRRRRGYASSSAANTRASRMRFRRCCWCSRSPSSSVIAVMVIQFQSFIEPLVVLLAAPLSFVGAMVLLLVTGTPLNVSSFMGLILLVGLIVKNGIILLDFTRHLMRDEGLPLEPALREAARIRLRPILMTTLCTLFGLLPLALGLGAGSELQTAARAGGDRRPRAVDADHAVRGADAARGDPRPRPPRRAMTRRRSDHRRSSSPLGPTRRRSANS